MALYRSLLRAYLFDGSTPDEKAQQTDSGELLVHAVMRTNQYVCQTHNSALFATLFAGILEPTTGKVHYINAGHNPPQLLKQDRTRLELKPTGPLIGIMEHSNYTPEIIELSPGETLCIYSDGVEGSKNEAGEFYGLERLTELLAQPANSADETVKRIATSLTNFMGETKPFDDVTVLLLMRQAEDPKGEY
jgi:sigma-B regulation protein RsbU (phosphoserine phosphatase)